MAPAAAALAPAADSVATGSNEQLHANCKLHCVNRYCLYRNIDKVDWFSYLLGGGYYSWGGAANSSMAVGV